ncbi:hypothetical protein J6P04_02705 [bacterium]|nr:hypothetical protein [bacterium]
MKKKNKIIIGSLSAIGVGSIILAPALGSTNNNSNNNQQTKTKVANKQVAKSNLATNDYNQINSHTFNDNAYLTTLNQKGIPNPVGKV